MIALIDGDILVYRIGFASQTEVFGQKVPDALPLVKHTMDEYIKMIRDELEAHHYTIFLSGSDNYRKKLCNKIDYKGNRTADSRPILYNEIRDYLVKQYSAIVVDGKEADDALGIEGRKYGLNAAVICSVDKDLLMIPGQHYNFVKKEFTIIDEETGYKNFMKQLLMGDRVDNIPGIYGIGPKKADKIIDKYKTKEGLFRDIIRRYKKSLKLSTVDALKLIRETGQLLWIQQEEGVIWDLPERYRHFVEEEYYKTREVTKKVLRNA